jgi:hypothetical protein
MASFVCNLSGLIALSALLGVSADAGLGTLLADPISWRLEWPRMNSDLVVYDRQWARAANRHATIPHINACQR